MAEFKIINIHNGRTVGNANTIGGARKSVDRNDNKYGSYAHKIVDSSGTTRYARNPKKKSKK